MRRCNGNTSSKRRSNDENSVKEEHVQVVFKWIMVEGKLLWCLDSTRFILKINVTVLFLNVDIGGRCGSVL